MPHQDRTIPTEPTAHHQDLKAVLDWLTAGADFAAVHFRGTGTWSPRSLTCTASLGAWSDETTLIERFTAARKIALAALGLAVLTAATYQAFLKRLRARTTALALALVVVLRRRMQQDLGDRFTTAGFAAFGVD